jgi:hypothetical protein
MDILTSFAEDLSVSEKIAEFGLKETRGEG